MVTGAAAEMGGGWKDVRCFAWLWEHVASFLLIISQEKEVQNNAQCTLVSLGLVIWPFP